VLVCKLLLQVGKVPETADYLRRRSVVLRQLGAGANLRSAAKSQGHLTSALRALCYGISCCDTQCCATQGVIGQGHITTPCHAAMPNRSSIDRAADSAVLLHFKIS
jgi:hypothetical protein